LTFNVPFGAFFGAFWRQTIILQPHLRRLKWRPLHDLVYSVDVGVNCRLREILNKLASDQGCSRDHLIETLEYAAKVAENIYVIEVR